MTAKDQTPKAAPPAVQQPTAVEQWSELPAFDDGTAAFVEHFGLTAPRLKTDFGKNGNGFVDEQTGEKRDQLNLVMLAFPPSRSYWAKQLSEGGAMGDPPDCRSTFGALTVPDADAPDRQAETCAACPHSQWDNGEPPRCTEAVNVFAFDRDVDSYYWLRFKRTSLKPFRAYVSSLLSKGRPLFSVMTNIKLKDATRDGFAWLVPAFTRGEDLAPADVAPMREVAMSAMKSWTAVAEEMAAAEREGGGSSGGTGGVEASPAVTVQDSEGQDF